MSSALIQRASKAGADLPLGMAVASLRRQLDISARALSLRANLSESYCGKLEKGEIEPSLRAFASIAYQLGLTPHEVHVLVMNEALLGMQSTNEI